MKTLIRHVLLWALVAVCTGCVSSYRPEDYQDVTIDQLFANRYKYDGKKVRVGGFLVTNQDGVQLLDPNAQSCNQREFSKRRYVTTSLPFAALGKQFDHPIPLGPYFSNDGHYVVVVGVFTSSGNPWPRSKYVEDWDPWPAVGPLKKARVINITERMCEF